MTALALTCTPSVKPPPANFADATAWTVTLHYGPRRMTLDYYMGTALDRPPTLFDVTASLFSDAATVDDAPPDAAGFEWWAESLGLNPDSRKDEATYRAVVAQTETLRAVLDSDFDDYAQRAADFEGIAAGVVLRHDGDVVAECENGDAAVALLHSLQGQSVDYATRYGGWSIDLAVTA